MQTKAQNKIKKDVETIILESIVTRIFGKNAEVGKYDHDGKYIIKLNGKGLLFQSSIDRLEDCESYCKVYAIASYDDQLSLIVQLKERKN